MQKFGGRFTEARRAELRRIGEETMDAINRGSFNYMGAETDLSYKVREAKKATEFYASDSDVGKWNSLQRPQRLGGSSDHPVPTYISILQISTIDAARLLDNMRRNNPAESGQVTGVLNFASATKPGGGFKSGAEAQEESIARSSTLYPTLKTTEASKFYKLHEAETAQNLAAYYSHAMIYSPKVTVFRDDDGLWTPPFDIDVLTCAAVNAGEIFKKNDGANNPGIMVGIEKEMKERMGRILYLFEQKKVRNLVLGSFGTGVFRNDLPTVTRIWADLLLLPTARFKDSFDRVIFAVTGDTTFANFKSGFDAWELPRAAGVGQNSNGWGLISKLRG